MSNSRASQLQPLSVPTSEFKCYKTPKTWFTSPVSVETSPLKLESPIDFEILERASPSARFGMDIGGTLCKVVYFEPARELFSPGVNFGQSRNDTKSVKLCENDTTKMDKSRGRVSAFGKPSEDMYSEPPSDKGEKSHKEIGACGAQPAARIETQTDRSFEMNPDSSKSQEPLQNLEFTDSNMQDGRHGKTSPGCFDFNSIKTSFYALTEELTNEGTPSADYPVRNVRKIWLSSHSPIVLPGRGTLHFKCFETWRMEEFLRLTREHSLVCQDRAIGATGGGACKFLARFSEIAGLRLEHNDELKSLVRGIDFLVKIAQHESFEYPIGSYRAGRIQRPWKSSENCSDDDANDVCPREKGKQQGDDESIVNSDCKEDTIGGCNGRKKMSTTAVSKSPLLERDVNAAVLDGSQSLYPYLVVNIGSGVSILRVDSPDQFQRVGGTSLGGSTFLGLVSALTGCNSFEEALNLATRGDSTQIDMLVGDIYGGDYTEMGLAATTVASSFGKLVEPRKRDAAMQTPEHLAKAVLLMITNNIGSIAMLHARAAGVDNVLFTGSFLHGNKVAMRLLAVAMEFWSKSLIKAIFLRHEGHAGAVGAMLHDLDPTSMEDAFLLI